MRMKKTTAVNIALLLVSLFGVIFISEIVLRFFEKPEKETVFKNTIREEKFPYRFIPGSTYTETNPEFSMFIKINMVGLRDYEYGKDYFKNSFVILGTGDSFTWGVGVNMEDGHLAVAEEILNKDSAKIKIIKAGMPGFSPSQELDFVKYYVQEKLDVKFNLITISFLPHDIDEMLLSNSIRYGKHEQGDMLSLSGFRRLIQSSLIYGHIRQLGLFRAFKGKSTIYYGRKMNEEEKHTISQMIKKAESFSASTPIVFVLIPQMDNVLYKVYPDVFTVAKEESTAKNIYFIDTYEELVKHDAYSVFYKKDQHLTKLGQRIVGEILAKKIEDMSTLLN
jgi:hypothetical protein